MISRMSGVLSASPAWVPRAVHASCAVAAQIAARGERQKRLDRRARQGDDPPPVKTALGGRLRRGGADKIGQAVEIGRIEHELPFALVMQHVLAEQGVQCREPFGDRGHARLLFGAEQRAVAHEAQMIAFEKAHLVLCQTEFGTPRIKIGNAREQPGIESDPHLMLGEFGREVAGDGFEFCVCVARIEIGKNPVHPVQQPTAALNSFDCIGKARRPRRRGDPGDFSQLFGHRDRKPAENAPGEIRSKGGMPNGVSQASKNGFSLISLSL